MCTRSQERLLGDHRVMSHEHVVLVVKPHTLADPGPRADMEFPRELHSGPRPKDHPVADLCTESSEDANTKT